MRLISCHIENFGKLSDYTIEFDKSQNVICEDNGWGKSTLAAFIRAMFYGFEGEKKRNNVENERKRYKPWQGGVYGGKLSFETNGKRYLVTRVFGDKEQNDTFELRDADTNLISSDYTSDVGRELFKIDSASFMRTAFIGQNEVETASTDDINAKIGNLSDNANDLNCYEKASGKLTELINSMTPRRATGSIARRINEIASLEHAVQSGSGIVEAINQNQEYLQIESENFEKKEIERKEAEKMQGEVSKLQTVLAKKEEWQRLTETKTKREGELKQSREYFPGDVPKLNAIKAVDEQCSIMDRVAERVSLYTLSDQEKTELECLKSKFTQGVAKDTEIDAELAKVQRLVELKQESVLEQLSREESERLEVLKERFGSDNENVNALIVKWNTRNTKKSTLPSNQAALAALQATEDAQKSSKTVPVVAILGMALVVISIIAIFAVSEMAGGIGSVIGTLLTIFGFVFHKKQIANQAPEETPQMASLRKTLQEDQVFVEQVDNEIKTYLTSHGKVFDEYMVASVLQELVSEQVEYERLNKKNVQRQQSTKNVEIAELKESIDGFLKNYGIYVPETQFSETLHLLKSDAQKYLVLLEKQRNYHETKELYDKQRCAITDFLEKHGWIAQEDVTNQVKHIQDQVLVYENIKALNDEITKELQAFEEKTDVLMLQNNMSAEGLPSLDELNQRLQMLAEELDGIRKRKQEYIRKLEVLQEHYEEWEEKRLKLEEEKALQQAEREKYNRIVKAKEYLGIAKESMTSKYARPLFESFSRYFEMITDKTTEHYHIDANATITVEEYGIQRETKVLSSGYKDLVGLCLRIALVDAMYQEELPMLIMDDPFVNLDDDKVEAAKAFLQEISKKYQVIYFTCSKARK